MALGYSLDLSKAESPLELLNAQTKILEDNITVAAEATYRMNHWLRWSVKYTKSS